MRIQLLMKGPEAELTPEGCHHYNSLGEVPWDIQKYTTPSFTYINAYWL